jgi:hypothetical protein
MSTHNEKKDQLLFIKKYIKEKQVCSLANYENKETYPIKNVSPRVIRDILLNAYTSGDSMEAVTCFIDNLFSHTNTNKTEDTLYTYDFNMKQKVKEWLVQVSKMKTDSSYGDIYFTSIISKDIKVLVKTFKPVKPSKFQEEYTDIVREYFIGIHSINKLRRIIPNYMYTLGMFSCSIQKKGNKAVLCEAKSDIYPFMVVEQLEGSSVEKLLSNDTINYEEWLGIYVQLLIALEVGQREIGFCHYDLHIGNVICRQLNTNYHYSVNLDSITYDITSGCIPTIIDFGMSTARISDGKETRNVKTFSHYSVTSGGIRESILHSGFDMFRFIISSYKRCNFRTDMIKLFDFFSGVNPYQKGEHITDSEVKRAYDTYSDLIFSTEMCKLTPKMFLEWILANSGVDLSKTISKKPRDNYVVLSSLKLSTSLSNYNNIFSIKNTVLKNFTSCLTKQDYIKSYILSKYIISILSKLNNKTEKENLEKEVKTYKTILIKTSF